MYPAVIIGCSHQRSDLHSALERVSTGTGFITVHTYEELLAYDFGVKKSPKFAGLRILKFEEILKRYACHTVMNIHLKPADIDVHTVAALIRKYDCEKWCYFMSGDDSLFARLQREVPQIARMQTASSAASSGRTIPRRRK